MVLLAHQGRSVAAIAALAMPTVLGLLVYSLIQRQVHVSLRVHDQQLPGNKGATAPSTAAVVLALFAQVALITLLDPTLTVDRYME
jgi:hypothetical protein